MFVKIKVTVYKNKVSVSFFPEYHGVHDWILIFDQRRPRWLPLAQRALPRRPQRTMETSLISILWSKRGNIGGKRAGSEKGPVMRKEMIL